MYGRADGMRSSPPSAMQRPRIIRLVIGRTPAILHNLGGAFLVLETRKDPNHSINVLEATIASLRLLMEHCYIANE